MTPLAKIAPFSATPPPNFAPPSSPFNSILESGRKSVRIASLSFAFLFRYFSPLDQTNFSRFRRTLSLISTVGSARALEKAPSGNAVFCPLLFPPRPRASGKIVSRKIVWTKTPSGNAGVFCPLRFPPSYGGFTLKAYPNPPYAEIAEPDCTTPRHRGPAWPCPRGANSRNQ
jgi:hypothetical protein